MYCQDGGYTVISKEVYEAIKEAGGEYRRDNFESYPEQS